MIARTEADVAEGHLSSRLHHQRAALLPGIPRRLALPEAVQLRPSPAHERERIEERQRHGPFHAGEVVRLARRIRQDRDRGWEPDVLCPRLRHGTPAVPNHGELSARLRELIRARPQLGRLLPAQRSTVMADEYHRRWLVPPEVSEAHVPRLRVLDDHVAEL